MAPTKKKFAAMGGIEAIVATMKDHGTDDLLQAL
jgi:hypothetical protein